MKAIGRWSVASFISVALAFFRVGLAIAFFIAVVSTAALPFFSPNFTVIVPVSFRLDNATELRGRPDFGFQLQNEKAAEEDEARGRVDRVDGALRMPTSDKTFIALNAGALIAILLVAMLAIDKLRAVLQTLIHGNPFVSENATRIRWVALAVIAGEFARTAIIWAENHYAATHVAIAGVTFDSWPHLSVRTIIYGLIILVIAEVFRAGARLDEEQSLTI